MWRIISITFARLLGIQITRRLGRTWMGDLEGSSRRGISIRLPICRSWMGSWQGAGIRRRMLIGFSLGTGWNFLKLRCHEPMDESPLNWIDTQRESMLRLLESWANINSESHNVEGLARMADAIQ